MIVCELRIYFYCYFPILISINNPYLFSEEESEMEEEENNLFFYLDEKNQALPLNELPVSQNKGPSIQGEILPNFFHTPSDEFFLLSLIVIV